MKNIFTLLVAGSLLSVNGVASELEHSHEKESRFYVSVKALVT